MLLLGFFLFFFFYIGLPPRNTKNKNIPRKELVACYFTAARRVWSRRAVIVQEFGARARRRHKCQWIRRSSSQPGSARPRTLGGRSIWVVMARRGRATLNGGPAVCAPRAPACRRIGAACAVRRLLLEVVVVIFCLISAY